jgi:hypothetical protein
MLSTGNADGSVSTLATAAPCFALNLLRSNSPLGLVIDIGVSGEDAEVSFFSTALIFRGAMMASLLLMGDLSRSHTTPTTSASIHLHRHDR